MEKEERECPIDNDFFDWNMFFFLSFLGSETNSDYI